MGKIGIGEIYSGLDRRKGVEPSTFCLPRTSDLSDGRESDPQLSAWEADVLPLNYHRSAG